MRICREGGVGRQSRNGSCRRSAPPFRNFIKSTTAVGLGAAIAGRGLAQEQQQEPPASPPPLQDRLPAPQPDDLRVALIGCGEQGRVLMESCLRIPGIRVVAVCDIWEYSRQDASGYPNTYGH